MIFIKTSLWTEAQFVGPGFFLFNTEDNFNQNATYQTLLLRFKNVI